MPRKKIVAKTKLERLQKQLQDAERKYEDAFRKAPLGMDYNGLNSYMKPFVAECGMLRRKVRMLMPCIEEELEDITDPESEDIMSLNEFIECVKSGGFIDYDGYGSYLKDGKITNINIYPSDVAHNCIRKEFSQIIWYNR